MTQSLYNSLHALYPNDVIPYYCKFHSGMDATLTIAGEPISEFSMSTFLLTLTIVSVVLLAIIVKHQRKRE